MFAVLSIVICFIGTVLVAGVDEVYHLKNLCHLAWYGHYLRHYFMLLLLY